MFLKMTDEAQAKLQYRGDGEILLDMNDGVGEYSKVGICSLDTSFRFLIIDKDQSKKDYDTVIDSTIGEIPVKEYSKRYLDEEMTLELDKRLQVLKLNSSSGLLDGHVEIMDLRPEIMRS
ncbi:iron-sulfur cluster biosynthesis family protein [Enterococcus sp. BWB1-3]|uniref:iron-sulfur cluster biosynthesis family protein n=1 Tax=unclassified Enterococcus TaxID=2608891 RepID=UPI001923270E|nr:MULTISPECIES: iron-sulfur cluster biosynthesis family protein [unclassified Enterococcus]MBL1228888.1 iron-sulfur cluster biosynthesis family protein [Enterococcus sp. BWB1-3]MCB5951569.1 iron-sulfur cluster biosynthesis family protein [Enterococcus sp. BWT-B8]MCB5954661.1 iron-sulfur cluster biosynthesis family protein [Enterococcus sp. CWB-B31]